MYKNRQYNFIHVCIHNKYLVTVLQKEKKSKLLHTCSINSLSIVQLKKCQSKISSLTDQLPAMYSRTYVH